MYKQLFTLQTKASRSLDTYNENSEIKWHISVETLTIHIMRLQKSVMRSVGAAPQRALQVVARAVDCSIFAVYVTDCVTADTVWRDELVPDHLDVRAGVQLVDTDHQSGNADINLKPQS